MTEPQLYRYLKLIPFLLLAIPSICLSLFIFYKCLRSPPFRARLNNQSIVLLILVAFLQITIELPITLQYLRTDEVQPRTDGFCLFWTWLNFSLQSSNLFLMTWLSIERHLLIFHSNLVQTFAGKMKWHFIPLGFCCIYIPAFYLVCIFIYPCQNAFNYNSFLCGSICYNATQWLSTFDWITNILIPSLLIPIVSLSLLGRVFVQMTKMKRALNWRSTRKMTVQLGVISVLYIVFWLPLALVSLIRIYFLSDFLTEVTIYYLNYTPYLVQLLMPFLAFACLPELWQKNAQIHVTQQH